MLMRGMIKKALLALLCIIITAEASLAAEPGTIENPIKCQAPEGEGAYLFRLRLPSGEKPEWNRQGSTSGEGHTGHHFDIYNSNHKHTLIMCMYHPRYVEIAAPKGFRLLTEWSKQHEYVNGKIHKWDDPKPFTSKIEEGDEDGFKTTFEVQDGVIKGPLKEWFPDGKLRMEMAYGTENRPDGTQTVYHEDGKVYVIYTYRAGVLHGPFEYQPKEKGKKEMKGVYENGLMKQDEATTGK